MNSIEQAKNAIEAAWPHIKTECLAVLGSELHYQAMIYHLLRVHGKVPMDQIGMNVKMWIANPVSKLFQQLDERKHEEYRGGFETIPDVVIFKTTVCADWRRRNAGSTLLNMLVAIEVKASERAKSRLQPSEIKFDILKLAAHAEEVKARGATVLPVMLVIDSAPDERERMTSTGLDESVKLAKEVGVGFLYISVKTEIFMI